MLRSFTIRCDGEELVLKPKNEGGGVSISVAQSYFKVVLDERQVRQVLALMFPDTVWPYYASNLLRYKKSYILWKKNGEPQNSSHWHIPIFSFLGNLSYSSNGFVQIDPHYSALAKPENRSKPFVAGTSVWYFGKIKKDGFRIEIRLRKGVLFSHISLPLENPNEKALSVLQAFWGKRGDLDKLFPTAL